MQDLWGKKLSTGSDLWFFFSTERKRGISMWQEWRDEQNEGLGGEQFCPCIIILLLACISPIFSLSQTTTLLSMHLKLVETWMKTEPLVCSQRVQVGWMIFKMFIFTLGLISDLDKSCFLTVVSLTGEDSSKEFKQGQHKYARPRHIWDEIGNWWGRPSFSQLTPLISLSFGK